MKYVSYDVGALAWSQGTTVLRTGDSFDDDHPLVTERPELFTDVAPGATFRSDGVPGRGPVESTMTSGPAGVRVEHPATPVVKAPPRGQRSA